MIGITRLAKGEAVCVLTTSIVILCGKIVVILTVSENNYSAVLFYILHIHLWVPQS
jgi:hypothetical protein